MRTGLHALTMTGELSAAQYDRFLQDTGCMSLEDLAHKHLGADLAETAFWQQALDRVLEDRSGQTT